jgi:hypothetical protein
MPLLAPVIATTLPSIPDMVSSSSLWVPVPVDRPKGVRAPGSWAPGDRPQAVSESYAPHSDFSVRRL